MGEDSLELPTGFRAAALKPQRQRRQRERRREQVETHRTGLETKESFITPQTKTALDHCAPWTQMRESIFL